MIRETCGTLRGAKAHQAAREPWCGWCIHAERVVRLAAEAIPERPPSPLPALPAPVLRAGAPRPVTAAQAAANAALLAAELAEFEPDWIGEPGGGRHLRRVS
jgi:hypothetical protein